MSYASIDDYGIFFIGGVEIDTYYNQNTATVEFGQVLLAILATNETLLNANKVEKILDLIMEDKVRVNNSQALEYLEGECEKIITAIDQVIYDTRFSNVVLH